ncbi:MAG: N-acyl homoserine lactonase family protein, partial [Thermoplasmata archaeon]
MIKKIKLLTDGNFEIDLGLLVYGKTPYYGKKYMAALKPLLVVTESDNILIDSGAGELPEKYQKYQKVEREVGLVDSLKNEDLSPDDISIVINTHLHFDHCGGNKLFSNAKFYVQAKEREYVENPHRFMKGGYIRDYYEDINFEMLKGERWIVEDELEVIPTPGHTPGHQSVLIEAEDKKYIYCGDVAPLEENLRDRNIVGILFN